MGHLLHGTFAAWDICCMGYFAAWDVLMHGTWDRTEYVKDVTFKKLSETLDLDHHWSPHCNPNN